MATYFKGHPLGNSVLGSNESIGGLTIEQMRGYFEQRYSPGNMVLAASGNFDYDRLVAMVTERCGPWQHFDVGRQLSDAPGLTDTVIVGDANVARQHIGVMSPAPALQSDKRYAAQIAASILGGGPNSRLFYALIDPAIADMVSMTFDGMDGVGGFLSYLSCDPGRGKEVMGIFRDEMAKFMADGPTENEMTAARNQLAASCTLGCEMPMGSLMRMGVGWHYVHEYVPLDVSIDRYLAVTDDDVQSLVNDCDLLATSIYALGPTEEL